MKQPRAKARHVLVAILLVLLLGVSVTLELPPGAAGAEAEIYFTILHTNDEHSALIPHSAAIDFHPEKDDLTVGGFARLAHLVNELRAEKEAAGEPVVLLGTADFLAILMTPDGLFSSGFPSGIFLSLLTRLSCKQNDLPAKGWG